MSNEMTRREFVKTAGGGVLGALAWPGDAFAQTRASGTPLRYAIVGTGVRAVGMWGRPIANAYQDAVTFVGLCDINPVRMAYAKQAIRDKKLLTEDQIKKLLDPAKLTNLDRSKYRRPQVGKR